MRWLKIGVVIVGAVTITALGIDAADTLTGKGGTMLGQLAGSQSGVCPVGMVEVSAANSFTCVDKYEASTHKNCHFTDPGSQLESQEDLNDTSCQAVSEPERKPWRFITREQAQIACARAGKRLPSNAEWYQAALGTVDSDSCNINSSQVKETGVRPECTSASGAEDMIGNVWEWVGDDVIEGVFNGRTLPPEGYVTQVDSQGAAVSTSDKSESLFNEDYFWSDETGAYGVIRGGFYGSETDAGVYAFHAKTVPTFAATGIGFRCVR